MFAEAKAVLAVVRFVNSLQSPLVTIESDCKRLVDCILSVNPTLLWQGSEIVLDIKEEASKISGLSFSFAFRSSNRCAHWLASKALKGVISPSWKSNMPQELAKLLCLEVPSIGIG